MDQWVIRLFCSSSQRHLSCAPSPSRKYINHGHASDPFSHSDGVDVSESMLVPLVPLVVRSLCFGLATPPVELRCKDQFRRSVSSPGRPLDRPCVRAFSNEAIVVHQLNDICVALLPRGICLVCLKKCRFKLLTVQLFGCLPFSSPTVLRAKHPRSVMDRRFIPCPELDKVYTM